MFTQIFKYRRLHITIKGDTHTLYTPYYGDTTYLAIEPSGTVIMFDTLPVYDKILQEYHVSDGTTYDVVGKFDTYMEPTLIHIEDKKYIYVL